MLGHNLAIAVPLPLSKGAKMPATVKTHHVVRYLFLLTAMLSTAGLHSSFAQTEPNDAGSIRGQVTDPTGAVIPSATVSVTSDAGTITTTISDAVGAYTVRGLAPGAYSATVTA